MVTLNSIVILIFACVGSANRVQKNNHLKQFGCTPFRKEHSLPRVMIVGGADFIGMALVKKLKQMNLHSVKVSAT